eukprot:9979355-Heterocapsa_arctica.AAC.1
MQLHERQRDLRVTRHERKTWKGGQDLGILQRSPYWHEEKALAEHANVVCSLYETLDLQDRA